MDLEGGGPRTISWINKIVDLEKAEGCIICIENGIINHEPQDQGVITQDNTIDARVYQVFY